MWAVIGASALQVQTSWVCGPTSSVLTHRHSRYQLGCGRSLPIFGGLTAQVRLAWSEGWWPPGAQMNWVNSRNDFGHDDSTINIVMVIIAIIITQSIFPHVGRDWRVRPASKWSVLQRTSTKLEFVNTSSGYMPSNGAVYSIQTKLNINDQLFFRDYPSEPVPER